MFLYTLLFITCMLVALSIVACVRWMRRSRNSKFRWHVIRRPAKTNTRVNERLVFSLSTDPGLKIPKPWGW